MRTYTAELAPWRLKPLHPAYVDAAHRDVARIVTPGPRRHANIMLCPYCGHAGPGSLVATVRVGAKEQIPNLPLSEQGFELPDVRDRETEILIIHCTAPGCRAAIDPTAFLSPAVFFADKEGVQLLPDL